MLSDSSVNLLSGAAYSYAKLLFFFFATLMSHGDIASAVAIHRRTFAAISNISSNVRVLLLARKN